MTDDDRGREIEEGRIMTRHEAANPLIPERRAELRKRTYGAGLTGEELSALLDACAERDALAGQVAKMRAALVDIEAASPTNDLVRFIAQDALAECPPVCDPPVNLTGATDAQAASETQWRGGDVQ